MLITDCYEQASSTVLQKINFIFGTQLAETDGEAGAASVDSARSPVESSLNLVEMRPPSVEGSLKLERSRLLRPAR